MNIFKRRERTEQAAANLERIKAQRDQMRELAQKLGRANAVINQHETTIRTLNNSWQISQSELREARAHVADLAAENAELWARNTDLEIARSDVAAAMAQRDQARAEADESLKQLRIAEASLSGVHEQLRQEKAARARAEREAAETARLHQERRLA